MESHINHRLIWNMFDVYCELQSGSLPTEAAQTDVSSGVSSQLTTPQLTISKANGTKLHLKSIGVAHPVYPYEY